MAESSSIFSGVSEPIAVICVPDRICSAASSSVLEGVAVTMRFALDVTSADSPFLPDTERALFEKQHEAGCGRETLF
jgi:hypothetical protein